MGGVTEPGEQSENPEEPKQPEQPEVPEQPEQPIVPTEETRMADGGTVTFIEEAGAYYEVHTFRTDDTTAPGGQAEHTLTFGVNRPVSVEVLVVAGGGGGGSGKTVGTGGGGGAGRFVYHPAFQLAGADTISVKVGAGGNGASNAGFYQGDNGGDSEFVRDNDYQIIAKGGGGGGCANESGDNLANGCNGGSGGGSGADLDSDSFMGGAAMEGTVPSEPEVLNLGTDGNKVYIGGGAGGPGLGSESAISGVPTIYAIGGTTTVRQAQNGTGDGGYSEARCLTYKLSEISE